MPWILMGVLAAWAAEPVAVVELFTSEGCSSCPPAEALLAEVTAADPALIPLSFHVDYWDRLGWPDAYARPESTARLRKYGRAMALSSIYTPQLVVNGTTSVVGSDRRAVHQAIDAARAAPSLGMALDATRRGDRIVGTVSLADAPEAPADLVVAWTTDRVVRDIGAGENRGRTLQHVHVVRNHSVSPVRGTEQAFSLKVSDGADGHLVVLVQRRSDLAVLGAVRGAVSEDAATTRP